MHHKRLPIHLRRDLQRFLPGTKVHQHARARRLLRGCAQHRPAEVRGLRGLDLHILWLGALARSAAAAAAAAISCANSARTGASSGTGATAVTPRAAQALCRQRVQERLGLRDAAVSGCPACRRLLEFGQPLQVLRGRVMHI